MTFNRRQTKTQSFLKSFMQMMLLTRKETQRTLIIMNKIIFISREFHLLDYKLKMLAFYFAHASHVIYHYVVCDLLKSWSQLWDKYWPYTCFNLSLNWSSPQMYSFSYYLEILFYTSCLICEIFIPMGFNAFEGASMNL